MGVTEIEGEKGRMGEGEKGRRGETDHHQAFSMVAGVGYTGL